MPGWEKIATKALVLVKLRNFGSPADSKPYGIEAGPAEDPVSGGQRYSALPVTVSRSDGVLEYWSGGLSLVNSMHQRISMPLYKVTEEGLGLRFSNTPLLQHSTSNKYVEQSSVMQSPFPRGKLTRDLRWAWIVYVSSRPVPATRMPSRSAYT